MNESVDEAALLEQARAAQAGAYAPYSGFRVGAALLTASGRVFTAANVENAVYPAGICAERVVVPAAVSAGEWDFAAIAIVGDGPGPCFPCGICRQVLFEFAPDVLVLSSGSDGQIARHILDRDLLPEAFGRERLG